MRMVTPKIKKKKPKSQTSIFWKNHQATETPVMKFTSVISTQFWVYVVSTHTKSDPFQNGKNFFSIPEVGLLFKSSNPLFSDRNTSDIDEKVRNCNKQSKCLLA